jgi:hypothetical protein
MKTTSHQSTQPNLNQKASPADAEMERTCAQAHTVQQRRPVTHN